MLRIQCYTQVQIGHCPTISDKALPGNCSRGQSCSPNSTLAMGIKFLLYVYTLEDHRDRKVGYTVSRRTNLHKVSDRDWYQSGSQIPMAWIQILISPPAYGGLLNPLTLQDPVGYVSLNINSARCWQRQTPTLVSLHRPPCHDIAVFQLQQRVLDDRPLDGRTAHTSGASHSICRRPARNTIHSWALACQVYRRLVGLGRC